MSDNKNNNNNDNKNLEKGDKGYVEKIGEVVKSGAEYVKESAENAGEYIKETYNEWTGQETATDKLEKNVKNVKEDIKDKAHDADKEMGKKIDETKKDAKDLKENIKDKAHKADKEMGKKIDEAKS